MAVDSASFVAQLNESWPVGDLDPYSAADGQIVSIKRAAKNSFPLINSAVLASPAEMNAAQGLTSNLQTQLDGLSASLSVLSASVLNDLSAMSDTFVSTMNTLSASIDVAAAAMSASFHAHIGSVSAALNASKLGISATAANTISWSGAHQFFQTATPTTAVEGDLWFQLEGA